jgi:hypothetical protein
MNTVLRWKQLLKFLKITFTIFLFILVSLYGGLHFLAYKIKQESKYINEINYYIHSSKDLHTLCMLDYMINPNGKDMLEECKKITPTVKKKEEESLTPYYDFYVKYLQHYINH